MGDSKPVPLSLAGIAFAELSEDGKGDERPWWVKALDNPKYIH